MRTLDDDRDDDPLDTDQDEFDEPGLVACPFCREPISEIAEVCPHCRSYISLEYEPRPGRPRWVTVTAVVLILVLSGAGVVFMR